MKFQDTDTSPWDEVPADGGHVSERTGDTSPWLRFLLQCFLELTGPCSVKPVLHAPNTSPTSLESAIRIRDEEFT